MRASGGLFRATFGPVPPTGPLPGQAPGAELDEAGNVIREGAGYRRLTVPECMALQCFHEGYIIEGRLYQQYRQVGNAEPPPIAELMGRMVLLAESKLRRWSP